MQATLTTQFHAVRDVARRNLVGVTAEQSLFLPAEGGNCIKWLLGHLTWTYHGMLATLGQETFLDEADFVRFQRGTERLTDADDTPSWDDMLAYWDEAQKRFLAGLESLDPERTGDKAHYSPGGRDDETLGSLLAVVIFHQSYHVGQIGLVRRLAGLEGAIK
jgi:uncharacterized damage-inducible protein DinB